MAALFAGQDVGVATATGTIAVENNFLWGKIGEVLVKLGSKIGAKEAVKQGVKEAGKQGAKKTTENGIGVTRHSVSRKIERGIKTIDELDALKHPLKVKEIIIDKKTGLPSQRFIGRKAETVINPETSKIISTNPTSSKVADKLLRK
jgi:hypothetical protein